MAKRLNLKNIKRGVGYVKRNGLTKGYYKVVERISRDNSESAYNDSVHDNELTNEEILKQKKTTFNKNYLISIIVPTYSPDPMAFEMLLESVAAQTYSNWELCIADGSDNSTIMPIVLSFFAQHKLDKDKYGSFIDYSRKIKYVHLERNRGIAINTNEALKNAKGEYIALLDHDDLLTKDALFEVMKAINRPSLPGQNKSGKCVRPRFVYSDEDKVSYDGKEYFDWHKKTDFDPLMLLTNNYICHLSVVDTDLARQVGGFDPEFDGSQDYDFFLRCVEKLSLEEILHIPKVLYHWRSSKNSTAENPESKRYAFDAGLSAVRAHLSRKGIEATVAMSEHLGFANITFPQQDYSVKKMSRKEYESLNEDGVKAIKEDYILVLSDTLLPGENAIEYLKGPMCLDYVGAVTGKIIKGKEIESCGYEKSKGGGITPCFAGLNVHYSGYLHRAALLRSVDAFDTGCVLYKKSALKWKGDGTVLSEGFRCAYEPKAIFTRK